MNTKVIKEWIKALRSGKYKQCKRDLRNEDEFCVMGVLCDLHRKKFGGEWVKQSGRPFYSYKKRRCTITSEVRSWIGWQAMAITETPPSVIKMNDGDDRDFNFIADQLEMRMNGFMKRYELEEK